MTFLTRTWDWTDSFKFPRQHVKEIKDINYESLDKYEVCPKSIPLYFFPAVSNGERVGKLSVVVQGTFMHMRDFLLPHNTAGCSCRCQIAKRCNTCSSHSHFARDGKTLGAAILHQILSETWGYPSGKSPQNSAGFPGDHQQAEMLMSLTKCRH
jgi:hypothetical protein